MRIPYAYLIEKLQASHQFHEFSVLSQDHRLPRPRFLLSGQTPDTGKLYVCRSSDAPAITHSCAVLASEDPAGLMNSLQDLYDECEDADAALYHATSTGEIRELMDEMESLLGNPVLIYKSNYSIVACSGEVFSNRSLVPFRGSHLPYEFVNSLKLDPQYEEQLNATSPFFFRNSQTAAPALGMNLSIGADAQYRLTVLPILRPLSSCDVFLIELCSEHVIRALKNSVISGRFMDPTGRKERLIELFRSGVENENADPTVLEQGFSAQGWMPSHEYCCLSIQLGTPDFLSQTLDLICSQLEVILPTACIFPHIGTIAVFLNLNLSNATIEEILDKCVYYLRDNDLRTGVSNIFNGFQTLRSYHKQSLVALNFASRPQAYLWVRHFSDVVLDYILEQSNRELPLQLICSPKILQIRQYDQTHQTDFYATLECYIQNRFNAVQTAKELQIHRSTFLYRMERLQSLFQLDLSHRDSLLYALLSMKMLDLSKSMLQHE